MTTVIEIKTSLVQISEGNTGLRILPIWSEIMQKADEVGHFASEIVERVLMDRKSCSEKQAWVVAYFAKNNGLLK